MPTTGATTNWAGNITFAAARLHRPASLDELQADRRGSADRVRVLGTGHSFNRHRRHRRRPGLARRLPHRVEIDPDGAHGHRRRGHALRRGGRRTCTRRGFALANLASLPHISVAGAAPPPPTARATPTAVSPRRCRRWSSSTADGDCRAAAAAADPDGFPGAVVGLGALGIVTRAHPRRRARLRGRPVGLDGPAAGPAGDRFDEIFGRRLQRQRLHRLDAARGRRRCGSSAGPTAGPAGAAAAVAGRHPGRPPPPPGARASTAVHCTEQLGVPGPWHERLPHFRPDFTPSNGEELQSELLRAARRAAEALAALRRHSATGSRPCSRSPRSAPSPRTTCG